MTSWQWLDKLTKLKRKKKSVEHWLLEKYSIPTVIKRNKNITDKIES